MKYRRKITMEHRCSNCELFNDGNGTKECLFCRVLSCSFIPKTEPNENEDIKNDIYSCSLTGCCDAVNELREEIETLKKEKYLINNLAIERFQEIISLQNRISEMMKGFAESQLYKDIQAEMEIVKGEVRYYRQLSTRRLDALNDKNDAIKQLKAQIAEIEEPCENCENYLQNQKQLRAENESLKNRLEVINEQDVRINETNTYPLNVR